MKKTMMKVTTVMAAAVMTVMLAACSDSDKYSISKAETDLNKTEVGQLEAFSYTIPFNLITDADAEWEATIYWDRDECRQPAYVYPKKGKGSAVLKIVTLDNPTPQTRNAILLINFPKDTSKNIEVPMTQKRALVTNDAENFTSPDGNLARGIGYGYNAFAGYCTEQAFKAAVFAVDEAYDDGTLVYSFSTVTLDQREESGSSVEELARKLNTSMHASTSFCGFSADVDASFNMGQKQTSTNEFAWMDILFYSCRAQVTQSMDRFIWNYVTDEAYEDFNNIGWIDRRGRMHEGDYPDGEESWIKLVKNYGTHVVVGGRLGGKLHTQAVCNTAKITTAYNASAALTASYSGAFANINVDANVKAQMGNALSRNSSAFHLTATVRGGGKDDGSFQAIYSVLEKMNSALAGNGTEDDVASDQDIATVIPDYSREYEAAGKEWKESLIPSGSTQDEIESALRNVAIIDFNGDGDLLPVYELVDRSLPGGEERYRDFRGWYESELMKDASIVQNRLASYITIPPTKIDPMPDLTRAAADESLIQDIYLSNGNHVARICSEYIPIVNPSKRVNVIYPIVNGKPRYNLGIFCGDEASYPAQVSWGMASDSSTPLITTIKGTRLGGYDKAYLRGNHLTLFPDSSFTDDQYLLTTPQPFFLVQTEKNYPLVKINDFLYMRDLYEGAKYQDGTVYEWPMPKHNYQVNEYTTNLKAHGGFAPTGGWRPPYRYQITKMVDDLSNVTGAKPDGTIANSFLKGGVYGINGVPTGFYVLVGDENTYPVFVNVNSKLVYFGVLSDSDLHFWDGVNSAKKGSASVSDCAAFSIDPTTGNVTDIWYPDRHPAAVETDPNVKLDSKYKDVCDYVAKYPKTALGLARGQFIWYPLFMCQKAVK